MGSPKGTPLDSKTYMCKIIKMFEKVRSRIDWGIGLYHDVRESIHARQAIIFLRIQIYDHREPYQLSLSLFQPDRRHDAGEKIPAFCRIVRHAHRPARSKQHVADNTRGQHTRGPSGTKC